MKNYLAALGCLSAMTFTSLAQTASPLGKLPLFFEANQGQAGSAAAFLARTADAQCALSAGGMEMSLRRADGQSSQLKMSFVGANPAAAIHGESELAGKINYLTGSDAAQWHTSVPTFAKVCVEKIYPGVDVVFYGNQQQLEYDFNFAAGAKPEAVALNFAGADKVELAANGDLLISIGGGEIRQPQPVIFQNVSGARQLISGGYKIVNGKTVTFSVGSYDHSLPLVIDPVLSYSTLFGGNSGEQASAVAVNPTDGSIYIAGQTFSTQLSSNKLFSTGTTAYQTNFHGGTLVGDAFVARLDAQGTNLIYLTYLGGSLDDAANAIAVDAAGDAYVCGVTDSQNFPVKNFIPGGGTIHGTPDRSLKTYPTDGFVAKLDPSGSHLLYSTYLGGENYDNAYGISVDGAGNAFITGYTYSSKFPVTTNTAFQSHIARTNSTYAYYCNAYLTEIANSGTNLNYSTYLGGTNFDVGTGIACNNGEVFVGGYTTSTNFPSRNAISGFKLLNGSTNKNNNAASDIFVAAFTVASASNLTLLYSTLLGGASVDVANGIAADAAGNAYVAGYTISTNFPNTIALANFATNYSPSVVRTNTIGYVIATNAFLTQIKWNTTNAAIGYSAVFGGRGMDVATGVAVDSATGNAYVTGYATSTNFPVTVSNRLTKLGVPICTTNAGASDAFVTAFNADASALLYSTYLGGRLQDQAFAIAVDPAGAAYIVGQTTSTNFPSLNARQPNRNGSSDGFLTKISLVDAPIITLTVVPQNIAAHAKTIGGPAATKDRNLQFGWRMFPPTYTLECTTNVNGSNVWVKAPWAANYSNGWFNVSVPATNGSQFFRLHKN